MTNTNTYTCKKSTPGVLQRLSAGIFGAENTGCEDDLFLPKRDESQSSRNPWEASTLSRGEEPNVQKGYWQSLVTR